MKCEVCQNDVIVNSSDEGTSSYTAVNKKLVEIVDKYKIPFKCPLCGCLHLGSHEPIRDVVFLYPLTEKVEKIGSIYLPDDDYIGGNTQRKMGRGTAVVLGCGEGYVNEKNKYIDIRGILHIGDIVFFNTKIPTTWRIKVDVNDVKHEIVYCGLQDVLAIEEGINDGNN